MRIGLCTSIDNIGLVEKLGFDYIEPSVVSLDAYDDEAFEELIDSIEKYSISPEAFNVLFPGGYNLTGSDIDYDKITSHIDRSLDKVKRLGGRVVVFGSGGARRIPEGYDYEEGWKDLLKVAKLVGDIAGKYDIIIAMEPLNKSETNLLNSVEEGIRFVRELDHDNVKLLADFYHMRVEDEDMSLLEGAGDIIFHTHIAKGEGRTYPLSRDEDIYEDLFNSLKTANYKGRMSIEGSSEDIEGDSKIALKLLRELAK